MLKAYLAKVGGKELILQQWSEKKAAGGKSKKRGRVSTSANETSAKRGRKNGTTTASATPPAGVKQSEFRPPTGSWEDEVTLIDACEGKEGNVVVFLTWKGGHKTQHPLAQVYKRCPQKVKHPSLV
jgi:chromobox protein 1